jgi:hypothetical protein
MVTLLAPVTCSTLFCFAANALLFAQLIARSAKDIDVLIDSLPSEDSSPDLQVSEAEIHV